MGVYFKRQSDDEAVLLYKASTYCYKREYTLKYITIGLSLFFCFMGIFLNSYLFILLKNTPNVVIETLEDGTEIFKHDRLKNTFQTFKEANSLIASLYLIISIILNIKCNQFHREAVHLEELYDNYVYGLKTNVYISRSFTQPVINNYAKKLKQSDLHYRKKYFMQDSNDENIVFDNQKRIIEEAYEVLNYSKERWFIPAWIFILVLIGVCSAIVDSSFIETLKTIFFPSLTAISMIVSSWNSHTNTQNVAHVCLNSLNSTTECKSPTNLRNIQDAIFNYRMRSFMVPNFIVARYRRFNMKRINKVNRMRLKENFELAYEEMSKTGTTPKTVKKTTPKKKVEPTKPKKTEEVVVSNSEAKPKKTASPSPSTTSTSTSTKKTEDTPKTKRTTKIQ